MNVEVSVTNLAMAALILMGMALAFSRRHLHISFALCFLALGFLAVAFFVRLPLI